jgi:hypothetical protein
MESETESKLETMALEINGVKHDSLLKQTKKIPHLVYVLDVGGSLVRRYQAKIAKNMDWEEKNLTIANAIIFGLGSSTLHLTGAYFFGDEVRDSARHTFYYYQSFNIVQSLFRIAYSQRTGKAIGSISMFGLFFNPIYAVKELVNFLKRDKLEN